MVGFWRYRRDQHDGSAINYWIKCENLEFSTVPPVIRTVAAAGIEGSEPGVMVDGAQQKHHNQFEIALTDIQKTRLQQAIFQEEVIYEAG
jgi:hypothetical protein